MLFVDQVHVFAGDIASSSSTGFSHEISLGDLFCLELVSNETKKYRSQSLMTTKATKLMR